MNYWKTIDTAPRDGTWFMICREGEGFESYEIGRFKPLMIFTYEDAGNGLYRKNSRSAYDWHGFNNMHRATHWRTLPEPL